MAMAEPSPSHSPPPLAALTPPMAGSNQGSALPSPPASPTHSSSSLSSLSLPTNMSEGGFLSDFAWSSRAPSPPHAPHDLFHYSQAHLQGSDLRIPELELTSSVDSVLEVRQQMRVEGSTRIVLVGSGSGSGSEMDIDAEILNSLKATDDHANWEEWEEICENLVIRVSFCAQRDIWIGYIPETGQHDFLPNLERYLTRPFARIATLLKPGTSITNDLRALLLNTKLPYFTSVIVATSSGTPTPAQQNALSAVSPLLPTLPIPPPPRGTSRRKKRCISAFRPLNTIQLRNGLLGDRAVRATLMEEVVEGFLRWRERQFSPPDASSSHVEQTPRMKQSPYSTDAMAPFTDPLSLRSLIYLSYSILEHPLRQWGLSLPDPKASFSLSVCISAFVAGIGVGWILATMGEAGG